MSGGDECSKVKGKLAEGTVGGTYSCRGEGLYTYLRRLVTMADQK